MDEKSILVTGANGFLGQAILSRLQASGISVRATDLAAARVASDIVYGKADITRPEGLKPVLENTTTDIKEFGKLTDVPFLLNTTFNENELIVCKPSESLDCFL